MQFFLGGQQLLSDDLLDVKLYWYSEGSNFGDAINPFILQRIFSHTPKSVYPADAELFMIGSILQKTMMSKTNLFKRLMDSAKKPLDIWSSGFIRDRVKGVCIPRKLNVCAVRGDLSRRLLETVTGKKYQPVLGDGGLLIPRLFETLPEKRYSIGIVPHFIDEGVDEMQVLLKSVRDEDRIVISPLGDPLECALKIASCETILSSSLHGLIAADAFGIPNRQIIISDKIVGGLFKYNDYYSAFGKEARPLALSEISKTGISADDIRKAYQINYDQVLEKQDALYAAFPYKK